MNTPKRKRQPEYPSTPKKKKATKNVLTKDQVQTVRSIARSVALRAAETKSKLSSLGGSMTDGVVYARNICYNLTQGLTSETYLGEKIYIKNFHFKGQIAFSGSTDRARSCRLLVIRSDTSYTTSSSYGVAVTYSDIFRGSSNSGLTSNVLHVDLHKVKLLHDESHVVDKQFSGYSNIVPFDINIPINKVETFTGDNNGTFRDGQYFFIFTMDDLSGVITPAASIGYDYTINFKDE